MISRAPMYENMQFPPYEFREYPKHVGTGKFRPSFEDNVVKYGEEAALKMKFDPLGGQEITEIANSAEEEAAIKAKYTSAKGVVASPELPLPAPAPKK